MKPSCEDMRPTVLVIEDDEDVREALEGLFRSIGLAVELFSSVQDYLHAAPEDRPGCMILDVRLPGRSGLDFQEDLAKANVRRPIIFISGHADIAMSVRAMKAGAIEFLTKPVRDQDLLDAVQIGIDRDRVRRQCDRNLAGLRVAYASLTPREREVMSEVVLGRPNKQIAAALGIAEATIKLHRGQVMQKMGARTLVELVRMNDALGAVGSAPSPRPMAPPTG